MMVTIYITNYNYENYLKQSIESVLNQTLRNFELIIIDDGSTDGSMAIIEQYREHHNIRIVYQQNKGLNATNNVAMNMARGKYIMRLDADDFLEPSAIAIMSAIMEADYEIGLVFPDYYYVDEYGNRIGEERRHNFEKDVTLFDQPAHGACTMVRLDFLKKLGGYTETFFCQDGYELWIKFITFHKVTNISRPLFSYRKHFNNLTKDDSKIINTRRKIKEVFVKKHLPSPNTLAIIPVRNTFINGTNWVFHEINGITILEKKVEELVRSRNINLIVVSCAEKDVFEQVQKKMSDKYNVKVILRPKDLAAPKVSLTPTIEHALEVGASNGNVFNAIMTVALEYPFTASELIDETIDTLAIFKPDAVISVVADKYLYYQHDGTSLKPILNMEKYARYEREAVYKAAGGIEVCSVESFKKHKSIKAGKIGHVLVDEKSSFKVNNEFDLKLVDLYLNNISYKCNVAKQKE